MHFARQLCRGVATSSRVFLLPRHPVLGGAVGVEREMSGKPAGLRTNILICVGAALFTQLSISMATVGFSSDGRPYGDTTRITAQIVSGIGFLGAGAILHGQGAIIGLTTAATIWVVAAIGAAVGSGAYVDALGTTAVIMLVLVGLRPVERRLLAKRRRIKATLRVRPGASYDAFEKVILEHAACTSTRAAPSSTTPDSATFELELIGAATKQFDVLCDVLRRHEPDVVSITTRFDGSDSFDRRSTSPPLRRTGQLTPDGERQRMLDRRRRRLARAHVIRAAERAPTATVQRVRAIAR